tara:strand:+ start:168 stop:959 length:792 start_codon:yes stop_codon:yes gene_type:complete
MSLILIFVLLPKIRIPERRLMKPLWLRALCIGLCQICFIYSLQHLSLVESVVLFSTGPMFIPLLEKLIFSVRVSWLNILGGVMTFTGVLLLAGDVSGFELRLELLIGLAAGGFNAGSQLALYRASKTDLNAFEINFWTFLFASIVILPFISISALQHTQWIAMDEMSPLILIAALVGLAGLIINTQVFRSKAYKLAESNSQLAPLIYTNLLFTALWQFLFFNESYQGRELLGLALIILANVVCAFLPKWLKAMERIRVKQQVQ